MMRAIMRPPRKSCHGFTLVEMMVSMGIGMVVMAAVATTFRSQTRVYNAQEQINEMEQNARGALDVIGRELKMAGYRPSGMALTGVTYSASQLQIQADVNGDGLLTPVASEPNEILIYVLDNTNKQITRKDGTNSAQVLADNITQFVVDYLDSSGTSTTTTANIRQVRISITAQTAKPDPNYTANSGYRTYTIAATVTPVNLGL
jgi:type IV pilus assembly protein PilW